MRVIYVITGMGTGGAENFLLELISRQKESIDTRVLVLGCRDSLSDRLDKLSVSVDYLSINPTRPLSWFRVLRAIIPLKKFKPDLIHGWMYHGNLAALLFHFFLPSSLVIWNIRQSLSNISLESKATRHIIQICRLFSRYPRVTIYNSHTSMAQHSSFGYVSKSVKVIANGFDSKKFFACPDASFHARKSYNISESEVAIGHLARFHPMKDHKTFLAVVRELVNEGFNIKVVMGGLGVDNNNQDLFHEYRDLVNCGVVCAVGRIMDARFFYAALDVLVSSSAWGEGFPNVVGEAMLCEVPCLATDVGDSGALVGNAGLLVPVQDAEAMRLGLIKLIKSKTLRRRLGRDGRSLVKNSFALQEVSKSYLELYGKLVS